jgi:catechol 2,3-dioxygenase-like lactoylglutathione lyase family enzyme
MDIKLSTCFLTVDDQEKALAFYRDVLGLEVRNDREQREGPATGGEHHDE